MLDGHLIYISYLAITIHLELLEPIIMLMSFFRRRCRIVAAIHFFLLRAAVAAFCIKKYFISFGIAKLFGVHLK